jgi:hypothetical protein
MRRSTLAWTSGATRLIDTALVITMTKQHKYHHHRDHAGNDQVLAEAPATWRAHGIVNDRLLGEGLPWIQLGFGPDGFVKLLIVGLVDGLRYVGITDVRSAFAADAQKR